MDSYEECIKNEINQIANKNIYFDIDAIMSVDNEVSDFNERLLKYADER